MWSLFTFFVVPAFAASPESFLCLSLAPLKGRADLEVSALASPDWRSIEVYPFLTGTQTPLSDGIGDPPARTRLTQSGTTITLKGTSGLELEINLAKRARLPRQPVSIPNNSTLRIIGVYEARIRLTRLGPWNGETTLACAALRE
jgi:hypothetical protein